MLTLGGVRKQNVTFRLTTTGVFYAARVDKRHTIISSQFSYYRADFNWRKRAVLETPTRPHFVNFSAMSYRDSDDIGYFLYFSCVDGSTCRQAQQSLEETLRIG
jgi:hypothetical protein